MTKTEQTMNKKFLDLWREMETALNEEGPCTVLDLEHNLDARSRSADVSKLRICRQIRNFLVHDGHDIVAATQAMCDFITAMTYEIRRARGTAKNHMMTAAKYGALGPEDSVAAAGAMMLSKKRDGILILDGSKRLLGVFGTRAMAMSLADGYCKDKIQAVIDRNGLDRDIQSVLDTDPAKSVPDCRAVVTDAKGRCVGVVNPEGRWQ